MATVLEQIPKFVNEPLRSFQSAQERAALEAAIARERKNARDYQLIIGGKRITADKQFASINPSRPSEIVGRVQAASVDHARDAIAAAQAAFPAWSRVPAEQRAELLFKAADAVRQRREEFDALLVLEVGKSWPEADGDIAEGIDFLEYYAREMLRFGQRVPLTPLAGEDNEMHYIPLGVGVVIPPWNFAFAIMAGMTSAAIVAGNTVVLKPSSDSPVIAARFVELLESCGLPAGVVNLVTGSGGAIGDALVSDPRVRFISFTGSKEVGLRINRLAAEVHPGQHWIKRVVAEMGGKDGIVVAADADVAAAVEGVASAAFGFQGQKCSACSRAIIEAPIYDDFVRRLAERVETITVGDPADAKNSMGPVINERSRDKIESYIKIGKDEGTLLTGGERVGDDGYFLEPTVFTDIAPDDTIAQEEIFGPVLAVIKAKNYDDALAIANSTEFGLTGSVYSRDRAKLERARAEFHVGNLYFNRKCTGAMVGVHPFGGFNMSGTDSKAGGPDYLLLFLQAKSVSEKV
ncbi:MAG: L-glutamate gamma-semialdehyde dehydrogenase [Candidatus Eremiobacteraeota bacterium]|nr:L-glutamate gamma-semialdehyde dehydrogenase [Candidatus Eremiobacteraeota bacterium]MBV8339443.1 L-glutamate gamma-semialdehyde dehydrogenase [Candidatus Eremiobacteraeota bacterium]MBV8460173.1 L-glutamate gamma-semialdehyde dehydrogenase [Candidatus Eremiobacteraeota bacterium]MBV8668641.1 L-glutamate gamma-semialdehyde dehydrogenase [Candidatus Eremiobacteraeota bacterium]